MQTYLDLIKAAYTHYWHYLKLTILIQVNWENYFYRLLIIALFVWVWRLFFLGEKNNLCFENIFGQILFTCFFIFFIEFNCAYRTVKCYSLAFCGLSQPYQLICFQFLPNQNKFITLFCKNFYIFRSDKFYTMVHTQINPQSSVSLELP